MEQASRYTGQQELGRGISPVNGLRIDTSQAQQAYGSGYNSSATVSSQSNGMNEAAHARSNETSAMEEDSPVEEDVLNEDDQFSDELSSSPSVPDEDIDFEHVYALHTFLATVDGQASVSKGDSLTLLDDSNSYWWLVRVLKTQAVGYIPAENIETPYERLARLNKHRNVDLTGVTQEDRITGPTSTTAVRAIRPPVHVPKSKAHLPPKPRFIAPAGGKSVQFTAPTYFEHSGNEYSDEEEHQSGDAGPFEDGFDDDDDDEEEEDGSEQRDDDAGEELMQPQIVGNSEDQRGRLVGAPKVTPGHGVEDSESGTEDGQGSIDYSHDATITPVNVAQTQQSHQAVRQVSKGSTQSMQVDDEGMDASDEAEQTDTEEQHRRRARAIARGLAIRNAAGQKGDENTAPSSDPRNMQQNSQSRNQQASSQRQVGRASHLSDSPQDNFDPYLADTRKITLTPRIALEGPTASGPQEQSQQRSQNASAQYIGQGPKRMREDSSADPNDNSYDSYSASEDNHQRRASADSSSTAQSSQMSYVVGKDGKKHRKAGSGSSAEVEEIASSKDAKKKKSGGMFSGLFGRKKEKDKKEKTSPIEGGSSRPSDEDSARQSPVQGRSASANGSVAPAPATTAQQAEANRRHWKEGGDAYLADQTLKQQQIEAQQAMYNQYGIQRGPNDMVNSFSSVRSPDRSPNGLSPPSPQPTTKPLRPGSLMGTPGIGPDVPTLSVMRVFAGDTVPAEATFKTVLLSEATATSDLLRQALQRFRLPLESSPDFYLTVKEIGGEETMLDDQQKPLQVMERLTASQGALLPSVKRSSVSSISSISSNLSMHPAIAKLGMGDFSDDSTVKFYLNRRLTAAEQAARHHQEEANSQRSSAITVTPSESETASPEIAQTSSSSSRFALRVLVHPGDLPDSLAFDPQSQAIVPKSVLAERAKLSPGNSASAGISSQTREKVLFFPANANVSEVIETSLDRFGIIGGVVDGGDDVEDKLSKRRSVSRVRYRLAVIDAWGKEITLNPSRRILDAYQQPPIFKQLDRNAKDYRRRSLDASMLLGASEDVQASDPVFVLRTATSIKQSHRRSVDEQLAMQRTAAPVRPPQERSLPSTMSSQSIYATPMNEVPEVVFNAVPVQEEPVHTLRTTSQQNLSAVKNAEQGVDIVLKDRATIRSSRLASNPTKVRYSYIDNNGAQYDISDIIEEEWSADDRSPRGLSSSRSGSVASSSSASGLSSNAERPTHLRGESEDRHAVEALRSAPVPIGNGPSSIKQLRKTPSRSDVLEQALVRQQSRTPTGESLEDRISRVLTKVRSGGPSAGVASALRMQTGRRGTEGASGRSSPASGRSSPAFVSGRKSPASNGRQSPALGYNRAPSTEPARRTPQSDRGSARHGKQASINSVASEQSSSMSSYTAGTLATAASGVTSSPNTRYGSSMSQRTPVYREDFGLDILLSLVGPAMPASTPQPPIIERPGIDEIFGPDLYEKAALIQDPGVRQWHEQMASQFSDMEARLDDLLDSVFAAKKSV